MTQHLNMDLIRARHAIVDIETLSTKREAHILSIGIHINDMSGEEEKSFYEIFPSSINGLIDVPTVFWWMNNTSQAARQEFLLPTQQFYFQIWESLVKFLKENKFDYIWGNSNTFDLEILKYHLESNGVKNLPWKYKQECDLRTLFSMYPLLRPQMESMKLVPHIAIADAKFEWAYLKEIFNHVISKEEVKETPEIPN